MLILFKLIKQSKQMFKLLFNLLPVGYINM
jgi:hypothetical protein